MNDGLVKIILALIGLLGTIVTYVLVPYIKSKTTEKQRDNIYNLILIAVRAAEQIYNNSGQGKLKKEYVITYLNSRGIKLTIEDLDLFIEAAVLELNIVQNVVLD